jgi:2,3-bisphosphoglycerate-independent phosphoglycerate mutase
MEEPVAIAVLPDHPTPWKLKTHSRDTVPFLIYKPGTEPDSVEIYNENSVRDGIFGTLNSKQFMPALLNE